MDALKQKNQNTDNDLLDPNKLAIDLDADNLKPDIDSIDSQPTQPTKEPARAPDGTTIVATPSPALQINPKEGKLKHLLKSKKFWVVTVLLLVAGLLAAWFIQPSRLWIVNMLGMRANLTITTQTLPPAKQQPAVLQKVTVDINGKQFTSDDKGVVKASIPYGSTKIIATKAGYESATKSDDFDVNPFFYALGLGSKQSDDVAKNITLQLKSVGLPISFKAVDWLTDKPVTQGSFSVGDVVAKPDTQGIVNLTVAPTDAKSIHVHAAFGGAYNDKDLDVKLESFAMQSFIFTPGGKDYFVSKRTGVLSVYSSDIDGTNQTEIIKGTGQETSAINFAVSPSGKYGVLSSSREGKRDSVNTLLQKLYVINLATNGMTVVDEAQFINFADWSGDTLVYSVSERLPKATENSQRLASVDAATNKKTNLGTADYYSAVRVSLQSVVYELGFAAPKPEAATSPELRTVSTRGGVEKNLGYKLGTLTQTDQTNFVYQTSDNLWHSYNTNSQQVGNTSAPPSVSRAYFNASSPDGQNQIVIDRIDGKTTLLKKSIASGQELKLYASGSLQGPIRWLASNVIIFRIADSSQAADYVVSVGGGESKKITDVTATASTFTAAANYIPFY